MGNRTSSSEARGLNLLPTVASSDNFCENSGVSMSRCFLQAAVTSGQVKRRSWSLLSVSKGGGAGFITGVRVKGRRI